MKSWDMVRKISGKCKSASRQHLHTNFSAGAETKANIKKDMTYTLGDAFNKNVLNRHYSEEFQNYHIIQKRFLNFRIMRDIIIHLI